MENNALEYRKIKAVNASLIKECLKSPMHGWMYLHGQQEDTSSLSLGRLVHSLVLEPDQHDEKYFVIGKGELAKKYKDQAGSREIVREATLNQARSIAQSVFNHPAANEILKKSKTEIDLTFDVNGTPCKARVDAYTIDGILVELKTANEIYARDFVSSIIRYDYSTQMAFYREALRRNGIEINKTIIIQATTDSPYITNVYELDEDFLRHGDNRINNAFHIAAKLIDGWKPEAENKITKLNFPQWAIID